MIDQAPQWRDHGARYIVVADVGPLQRSPKRLAAMVPFAKILRGLKGSKSGHGCIQGRQVWIVRDDFKTIADPVGQGALSTRCRPLDAMRARPLTSPGARTHR